MSLLLMSTADNDGFFDHLQSWTHTYISSWVPVAPSFTILRLASGHWRDSKKVDSLKTELESYSNAIS